MSSSEGKVKSRIKVHHSYKFTGCYPAEVPCVTSWLPQILFLILKTRETLTEFQEEKDIWEQRIEVFKVHASWESPWKCSFLGTQTRQRFPPKQFLPPKMSSSELMESLSGLSSLIKDPHYEAFPATSPPCFQFLPWQQWSPPLWSLVFPWSRGLLWTFHTELWLVPSSYVYCRSCSLMTASHQE